MSNKVFLTPQTSAYTVIFKYNETSETFDSSQYSPLLTDGRASIEEIDRVLQEIANTVQPIQEKIRRQFRYYPFGFLLALIFWHYLTKLLPDSIPPLIDWLKTSLFLLYLLAVLAAMVKRHQSLGNRMRPAAQNVVDMCNEEFRSRGLKWYLPAFSFPTWIELWKNYEQEQQINQLQPIRLPLDEEPGRSSSSGCVQIPATTTSTVVFQYDNGTNTFDSAFYSPIFTSGLASREDINRVLREIEAVNKPIHRKREIATWLFVLGMVFVFCIFTPSALFVISISKKLFLVQWILLIVMIISFPTVFIDQAEKLNKQLVLAARSMIEKCNNQEFSGRGLKWRVPVHYPAWIELWKDSNQQQTDQPQPIYLSPVNPQLDDDFEIELPQYQQNVGRGFQGQNNRYVPLANED